MCEQWVLTGVPHLEQTDFLEFGLLVIPNSHIKNGLVVKCQ